MINNSGRQSVYDNLSSELVQSAGKGGEGTRNKGTREPPGLVVGHDDVWNVSADNGTHQSLPAPPPTATPGHATRRAHTR